MTDEKLSEFFEENSFIGVDQRADIRTLYRKIKSSKGAKIVIKKGGKFLIFRNKEKALNLFYHKNKRDKISIVINNWNYDSEDVIVVKAGSDVATGYFFNSVIRSHVPRRMVHMPKFFLSNIIKNVEGYVQAEKERGMAINTGRADYHNQIKDKAALKKFPHNFPLKWEFINESTEEVFHSYYINSKYPKDVVLNSNFEVKVWLATESNKKNSKPIQLAEGWSIDIVINVVSGLSIKGHYVQSIVVETDNIDKPIVFNLQSKDLGKSRFNLMALHKSKILFTEECEVSVEAFLEGESSPVEVQNPVEKSSGNIPDLTLLISEVYESGGFKFNYLLNASNGELGLYYMQFSSQSISMADPSKYFLNFFKDIEGIPLGNSDNRKAASRKLKAKGASLFEELFPLELREKLWEIKDNFASIIINSSEPWIPWEMFYFFSPQEGKNDDSFFLCEKYQVSRWIPGKWFANEIIDFSKPAFVFPSDTGLACQTEERNRIEAILKTGSFPEPEMITPTYNGVMDSFEKGAFNLWHFSCHGTDANAININQCKLILEDKEEISPESITGVVNIGKKQPVIFFNACHAGRGGMGLTALNGWPKKFIDNKVGAFIGAYWSIHDETAFKFSTKFYELLVSGDTIAEAFKKARLFIKDEDDPTWLAYTLYANPFARIN